MIFGAVEFPPIENLVEWPAYFGEGTIFEFNKIALINVLAVAVTSLIFIVAAKQRKQVASGVQMVAEGSVTFIKDQVILPAIGPDGMRYMPYLLTIFFFVFFGNITEVIPTFQMPANARMANPLIMALVALVFFIAVGVKHHGLGYFKGALFPPGVPKALYILVTPIEFFSTFLSRPLSLAVRLFANLLAGHILLVTFGVLCITLWTASLLAIVLPFSFFMLVALTGFEIMVAFLQAYIFAILVAVYIGGALHPEH